MLMNLNSHTIKDSPPQSPLIGLGFSIIELLIVMMVISILAVFVSIPWTTPTMNLGAQANQLVSDIRYTQSLSMAKDQRYRLVITSSTTYQITNSAGTAITLASGATTYTLTSGATFGTLVNLPNSLIAFDGKGIPYVTTGSPGTALSSTASIPMSANGQTRTITILPSTGRVLLQ